MRSARELIKILRENDESTCVEAKKCSKKVDKSAMVTICAFANEPDLDGGYIVLGLHSENKKSRPERYKIVGVKNPEMINHPGQKYKVGFDSIFYKAESNNN